ncbi:MAG: NTP transferase domain-containing protein [Armatimonadota bacterium]
MDFAAVILAAGKSTRMKSALPKAVHTICGKPVTRHIVDACRAVGIEETIVVVGYEAEKVKEAIGSDVLYAVQSQQLGTGHAAMQAMPQVDKSHMLLLPGDAPLITPSAIEKLITSHKSSKSAATLLTALLDEPANYGRIVRGLDGNVERIVEARDASPEVLAINEVATSIYCFDVELLKAALSELRTDNAQGEYYLTDTIEILRSKGRKVGAVTADDPRDTLGINTRIELADAASIMRRRILDALMLDGVTITDPDAVYIDAGVKIGRDSVICPDTVIEGNTVIGERSVIGPFVKLTDAAVGSEVHIVSSVVTGAAVPDKACIGPFDHIKEVNE